MLKKIFKFFGILLMILIISLILWFLVEFKKSDGNVTKATIGMLEKVADNVVEAKEVYVLFMGVSTDLKQKLTDTIMLMGYNPEKQKAFIVSIPRDTFVGRNLNTATAKDKINSLYSVSPEKTVSAVEKLTNVEIDYYVMMNTDSLIKIVDILGGVQFDVPINMNYDDKSQNLHIHLKKVPQLINGKKAEGLLRFRHNNNGSSYSTEYGDNDYGRMRTQREFIFETISQCLEVRDLDTMKKLVAEAFDSIETNCPLSYILSYLVYAYSFNMEDLILEQIPGESVLTNNVWVFKNDKLRNRRTYAENFK